MSKYKCSENSYFIDNKYYARVTSILGSVLASDGLKYFYGKHKTRRAEKIKNATAKRGSKIHKFIYKTIFTRTFKLIKHNRKYLPKIQSIIKLLNDDKLIPIQGEFTIVNNCHQYAGTADYFGKNSKGYRLIDWKTGKERDTHIFQLAMYHRAMILMRPSLTNLTAQCIYTGRTYKDKIKKGRIYSHDEMLKIFEVCRSILGIYNYKFRRDLWEENFGSL